MIVFVPLSITHKFNKSYHVLQRFIKTVSLVILLTNSTGRILLVKLRGFQAKKFTAFYGTRFFYVIHKSFSFFPILREINRVHALSLYLFNIYLKFIIPYKPLFSRWFLSLKFLHHNPLCISFSPMLVITLSLTHLISLFSPSRL